MQKYSGVLDGYFETGSEGVMWVLDTKDKRRKYYGLIFIDAGDHIKIYGRNGSIIFEGQIFPDYKAGWEEYPKNPGHGQPQAIGFWVRWTQSGWHPDEWAKLFIKHWFDEWKNVEQLKAELIKKGK